VGLGNALEQLELIYSPDPAEDKIFLPEPVIDAVSGTYSVRLEPNCEYTISARGANDYQILDNIITVGADRTADVVFTAKQLHKVSITTNGLTTLQKSQQFRAKKKSLRINRLEMFAKNIFPANFVYLKEQGG
jgi:hypothetical protein